MERECTSKVDKYSGVISAEQAMNAFILCRTSSLVQQCADAHRDKPIADFMSALYVQIEKLQKISFDFLTKDNEKQEPLKCRYPNSSEIGNSFKLSHSEFLVLISWIFEESDDPLIILERITESVRKDEQHCPFLKLNTTFCMVFPARPLDCRFACPSRDGQCPKMDTSAAYKHLKAELCSNRTKPQTA